MRKDKLVTRTMVSTVGMVICMDITTIESEVKKMSLVGSYDKDTFLKKLKAHYETDTFKVVSVQEFHEVEKLYGLSENDFMKYAKELDPVTRRPLNKQEQEQEDEVESEE